MLLLSILGYILLTIGILLAAIILIPYNYNVVGEKHAELEVSGSVSWLFGGIKLIFSRYSKQNKEMTLMFLGITKKLNIHKEKSKERKSKKELDKADSKHGKDTKTAKSKKRFDSSTYLKKDIIQKVFSLVVNILKHCSPKTLTIYARIGFNDPMYTGFLCAFNSQLCFLVNKYDINIQPVFDEEVIEGRFSIGGRIWLPYLILVMIGFLITKPIRNILLAKMKRKNKGGPKYVR